jgi:prepilin-type N-terminal cleavage/methylation domain-containing protein
MNMQIESRPTDTVPQPRAFTLIELLVVMIVIALIIAITLPALGGVRDSARRAGTQSMMTNITQAVGQFQTDHRRLPGYFPVQALGAATNNASAGMSAMENVMIELMGMQVQATNPGQPGWIQVGPATNNTVWVNYDLMGSAQNGVKNYYAPGEKHFVAQLRGTQQIGSMGNTDPDLNIPQMPDVVDDFGQPLLAWVQDDTQVGSISTEQQFALKDTSVGRARFYWQSNAAFLMSNSLGRRARSQVDAERGSWLASDSVPEPQRIQSLIGVLGNPSYPYRPMGSPANFVPSVPVQARGQFILHSAGSDGVYFGKRDKASAGVIGYIDYRSNFVPNPAAAMGPNNQYTTRDGKPDVNDFPKEFDDLLAATGN